MPNPLDCRIVLASKSPRRSQLLEQAGFQFIIRSTDTNEDFDPAMPALEVSEHLAVRKAGAARPFLSEGDVILAADSLVLQGDIIYEKPKDKADAQRMLRAISGTVHTVTTGVCLLSAKEQRRFTGISQVHVAAMSEAEIDFYIEQYQPYDKAGGYGIQEWVGLCKIHRIDGTYPNIMGLPVDLVYHHLSQMAW